jgi:hypothetical protein
MAAVTRASFPTSSIDTPYHLQRTSPGAPRGLSFTADHVIAHRIIRAVTTRRSAIDRYGNFYNAERRNRSLGASRIPPGPGGFGVTGSSPVSSTKTAGCKFLACFLPINIHRPCTGADPTQIPIGLTQPGS